MAAPRGDRHRTRRIMTIPGARSRRRNPTERRQVLVYRAPNEFTALGTGDRLEGEGALDGFSVGVEELFG